MNLNRKLFIIPIIIFKGNSQRFANKSKERSTRSHFFIAILSIFLLYNIAGIVNAATCPLGCECLTLAQAKEKWPSGFIQCSPDPCGVTTSLNTSLTAYKPIYLYCYREIPKPTTTPTTIPPITTITTIPSQGNNLPIAKIAVQNTGLDNTVPLNLKFDGSGSYDPDHSDSILTYFWTFGDGSSSRGSSSNHTYFIPGIYTVVLTVADSRNVHGSTFVQIRVDPSITPLKIENNSLTNSSLVCSRDYFGEGILTSLRDGTLDCTVYLHAREGDALLTFPQSIRALDRANIPITGVRFETILESGEGQFENVSGYTFFHRAYQMFPDGAAFNPSAVLTISLSEKEWQDIGSQTPVVMWYNSQGNGWEPLTSSVSPVNRSMSTPISHFSIFALFIRQNSSTISPVQERTVGLGIIDLIHDATSTQRKIGLPLSFIIPDRFAPLAAVCMGVIVAMFAATSMVGSVFSRYSDRIIGFLNNYLGNETTSLMSKTEIEKRGVTPSVNLESFFLGLSVHEWGVIAISALGFALAFILKDRLELRVLTLFIFVCVAGVATILHDLAHKMTARSYGCTTEYQFWGLGFITMFLTAWLFGTIFAKPSRTVIQNKKEQTAEESARIMISGPLVSFAVAIASFFLIPFGGLFTLAGTMGFSLNMLACVYALLPVIPMDGKKIYDWNKAIWAALFAPMFILYISIFVIY